MPTLLNLQAINPQMQPVFSQINGHLICESDAGAYWRCPCGIWLEVTVNKCPCCYHSAGFGITQQMWLRIRNIELSLRERENSSGPLVS